MQFDVHQNHQGYDFVAMAQARQIKVKVESPCKKSL